MKQIIINAIVGIMWGLLSLITLSGGAWLNPLIKYTFGLPTTFAFYISNLLIPLTITAGITISYILLLLLAPVIGALICISIGYIKIKYLKGKVK